MAGIQAAAANIGEQKSLLQPPAVAGVQDLIGDGDDARAMVWMAEMVIIFLVKLELGV